MLRGSSKAQADGAVLTRVRLVGFEWPVFQFGALHAATCGGGVTRHESQYERRAESCSSTSPGGTHAALPFGRLFAVVTQPDAE
jgi:hypothetical protein